MDAHTVNGRRAATPSVAYPDPATPKLTLPAKFYTGAVCLVGIGVCLAAHVEMDPTLDTSAGDLAAMTVFLALGGLAQLVPVRLHKSATISLSMAIALAALLVYGPAFAVWIAVPGGLAHYFAQTRPARRATHSSAVLTAALVISVWLAGLIYVAQGGEWGVTHVGYAVLPSLFVASVVCYMVNTLLITLATRLETGHGFWFVWRVQSRWLTVNIISLTFIGFGVALVYQAIGLVGLAFFLLPLGLGWYSFRVYSRTVEDVQVTNQELKNANERLNIMSQVSRSLVGALYLDETLDRIMAATRLMGFPAGFVAGPLGQAECRIANWRTTHPALAQWALSDRDRAVQTEIARYVNSLVRQPWFANGEMRVMPVNQLSLEAAIAEHGDKDSFAVLVLAPLIVRRVPWGIVCFGAVNAPSNLQLKEMSIFRSLAESALETALAHEQAELDALVDARTGLFNHRYFQLALQRELQAAAAANGCLSLLMIDINKFKEFNDLYGHVAGDQALEAVARILKASIRKEDLACRYGGDELCILMPNTDRSRATDVANRIDVAVRDYRFRVRRQGCGEDSAVEEPALCLSIGVASFPEAANTRAGLVEQADRACYQAKGMGGGVATQGESHEGTNRGVRLQVVK